MGQAARTGGVSEGMATFFVEKLCQEADFVLRICFALLLNTPNAQGAVQDIYQRLLPLLSELLREDSTTIRARLAKMAWEHCTNRKSQESDTTPLGNFLKTLKFEERGALVLIDEAGFSHDETANIMGLNADAVRQHLVNARQALITNKI